MRRVVVTGLGLVTPLGSDVETSWRNLIAGKSGIGPITRFDTSDHKAKIAGEVKPKDHEWGFDPDKRVDHKVQRQVEPPTGRADVRDQPVFDYHVDRTVGRPGAAVDDRHVAQGQAAL